MAYRKPVSPSGVESLAKKAKQKPKLPQKNQMKMDLMKENRRLRKELEESQKEVEFLKKAAVFFAKEMVRD